VLANKWTMLVMGALGDGPLRFGALRRRLDGITQKMLTQTLRTLERDGLVTRSITPTVPVRVDYELTELGQSLVPILQQLKGWSETHIEQVLTARASFEERAA